MTDFNSEINNAVDDELEPFLGTNDKILAKMIQQGIENMLAFDKTNNAISVLPQDPEYIGFNLYLCNILAETTLATLAVVNAKSVTVTSGTGALVGDCINIRQGTKIFQSIITVVSGNVITFASPLDNAFTVGALICFAEWNLSANGSVTPKVYKVCPPPNARFHIASISITMTDAAVMHEGLFGNIARLTKGIIGRRTDGQISNYFLISNNVGFFQNGYETYYPAKAPSGVYSFNARKKFMEIHGNVIALEGITADELQIIVQDDLTGIDEFTVTVQGHIVED